MSAPVTLGSILTSIVQRANIEQFVGKGKFISYPELRGYVNEYATELWDKLIEARSQEHARKVQTFSTANGQNAYPLAPDFYQLISVDIQISPGQYRTGVPYMESERNMFRSFPTLLVWSYWGPFYYRILGTPSQSGRGVTTGIEKTINFIQTPQAAYPVSVNYYPTFQPYDTSGDTLGQGPDDGAVFNGINGWEAYIIWGVVMNCKQKLKEDAAFAVGRFQAMIVRIEALAAQNDAGNAERVHDVLADYDVPWWGG